MKGLPHGLVGGTNDDATTASNTATGTLTGTGGDGALSFSFSNLNATTATIGQDTVTYGWNSTSNRLTATITASAIAGRTGSTLFTVDLNPLTGNYVFNLVTPVAHANSSTENDASVVLTFLVGDSDADTGAGDTGTGTLTVNLDDDMPINFTADPMRIENGVNAVGSGALNFYESIGADGGHVAFNVSNNTALTTTGGAGVTSGGLAVNLYVSADGTVLTAKTGADATGNGGTTIFTVTLNPNGTAEASDIYTVTFSRALDDGSQASS